VQLYGAHVLDHHAALLSAAAIDPQVAMAAGIRSVSSVADLPEEFRWLEARGVPALVFPWHRIDGSDPVLQLRPDKPVVLEGGAERKYLFAKGARNVLAVHPVVLDCVRDPKVPIVLVEGTKQYLAAVSALDGREYATVGIAGCYGWASDSKPIADMDAIPWDGREVYACFDADVQTKRGVWDAASKLAEALEIRGVASVGYVKVAGLGSAGLDDVLGPVADRPAAMLRMIKNARPRLPRRPAAKRRDNTQPYPSAAPSHVHTPLPRAETPSGDTCEPEECEATPPAWAKGTDILAKLVTDLYDRCGLTGEIRNIKLLYLVVVSRVLDSPASAVVKGLSSAGKSYTVECVLMAFPESAVLAMTAMSEHALVYMRESFSHRTLVLYEATALREDREKTEGNQTAMFIRTLMSEGKLHYPTVQKEPGTGELVTQMIKKEGPTNFIVTTTATALHPENETRMLSLAADDSKGQTTAVMKALARKKKRQSPDFGDWHDLDHWIRYHANHQVDIPYAAWLAENIPPVAVRLRRDFAALLTLIEAHAILHQADREVADRHIVASQEDYLAVRALVSDLMSEGVGQAVRASVRQTVEVVARLAGQAGGEVAGDDDQAAATGELTGDEAAHDNAPTGVTVLQLARELDIERSAAQYRVKAAREGGYIVNLEPERYKAARYAPGTPLPDEVLLLPERIPDDQIHSAHTPKPPADEKPQVSAGCEDVNGQQRDKSARLTDIGGTPLVPEPEPEEYCKGAAGDDAMPDGPQPSVNGDRASASDDGEFALVAPAEDETDWSA
jgi:Domain of unknown function (DUF3854)